MIGAAAMWLWGMAVAVYAADSLPSSQMAQLNKMGGLGRFLLVTTVLLWPVALPFCFFMARRHNAHCPRVNRAR